MLAPGRSRIKTDPSRKSQSGGERQVHQKRDARKNHKGGGTEGSNDQKKEATPAGTQRASQRRWPWPRAPYPYVSHGSTHSVQRGCMTFTSPHRQQEGIRAGPCSPSHRNMSSYGISPSLSQPLSFTTITMSCQVHRQKLKIGPPPFFASP